MTLEHIFEKMNSPEMLTLSNKAHSAYMKLYAEGYRGDELARLREDAARKLADEAGIEHTPNELRLMYNRALSAKSSAADLVID